MGRLRGVKFMVDNHNIIYTIFGIALILNTITFLLFIIDKRKAVKDRWRIPERVLLLWSFFAPCGAYLGMRVAHHKINKKKFSVGVVVFMVVQVGVVMWCVFY